MEKSQNCLLKGEEPVAGHSRVMLWNMQSQEMLLEEKQQLRVKEDAMKLPIKTPW